MILSSVLGSGLAQGAGGEHASRFDEGGIVQQHECLQRRVGPIATCGTLFTHGCVEGQQAGMQKRPLPVRVKAAAILVLVRIVLVGSLGESSTGPSSRPVGTAWHLGRRSW